MTPTPPLGQSLAHMQELLDLARPGFAAPIALVAGGDPYFIDLPAYRGGSGGRVTASSLRVIASLYMAAEIEGTYLMAVCEELANARYTLKLNDRSAAEKLETFASNMTQGWVDRALRNQIFARVFGAGHADAALGDNAVNTEFEPQFARFCMTLSLAAQNMRYAPVSSGVTIRANVAAQSLLGNLGNRVQGNTLIVTERLTNQLNLAIETLNSPGLVALFQARTIWDVIRGVLGPDTPELQGFVNRAQTGLRIFSWLSANLEGFQSSDPTRISDAIAAEPQLQGWSEIWLESAGINLPDTAPNTGWRQ